MTPREQFGRAKKHYAVAFAAGSAISLVGCLMVRAGNSGFLPWLAFVGGFTMIVVAAFSNSHDFRCPACKRSIHGVAMRYGVFSFIDSEIRFCPYYGSDLDSMPKSLEDLRPDHSADGHFSLYDTPNAADPRAPSARVAGENSTAHHQRAWRAKTQRIGLRAVSDY